MPGIAMSCLRRLLCVSAIKKTHEVARRACVKWEVHWRARIEPRESDSKTSTGSPCNIPTPTDTNMQRNVLYLLTKPSSNY